MSIPNKLMTIILFSNWDIIRYRVTKIQKCIDGFILGREVGAIFTDQLYCHQKSKSILDPLDLSWSSGIYAV